MTNRACADLVTRWLTAEGFACSQASSTQSAWEYFQRDEPSVMVLDIRMPGGSGIDLLPQVKAKYPDTEVIMMTAVGEADTAIAALTHGACAYLIKPVMREELLLHTRRAVEHRQLVINIRNYMHRLEDQVRQQTVAIRAAHEETIRRLVAASLCRDEETGNHLRRVGLLSELLGNAAGWSLAEVEDLRLAAPMHDIGKIGIPDAILRKAGKFTPEEFEIMQSHTVIGAEHVVRLPGSHVANGPGNRPESPRALGRRRLSGRAGKPRHPRVRPHRGPRRRVRRPDSQPRRTGRRWRKKKSWRSCGRAWARSSTRCWRLSSSPTCPTCCASAGRTPTRPRATWPPPGSSAQQKTPRRPELDGRGAISGIPSVLTARETTRGGTPTVVRRLSPTARRHLLRPACPLRPGREIVIYVCHEAGSPSRTRRPTKLRQSPRHTS